MDEPISARYVWDAEAMTESLAAHQRQSLRPSRFVRGLLVLVALAGSIGIPIMLMVHVLSPLELRRNAFIALIVICASWAWVATGNPNRIFLRWAARKVFRSRPNQSEFVEWTIDGDQLTSTTSLTNSSVLWPLFIKVVEAPKGFLLYQSIQLFNWIPCHAFASAAELRRFADLARSRVANYVVLGECQFIGKPEPIDLDEI